MIRAIFVLILFFYFLALFQSSFLIHFLNFNELFNLFIISIMIMALFEKVNDYYSIFSAAVSGFFWDISSNSFFGFHILILLLLVLLIKIYFVKYVRIPITKRV